MSFFSVRCFSGTSRVYRQDGSSIMMKDVRVGDHLLDAYGEFSEVLTFLDHRPDAPDTDYLQISTTESTLEITPTHLLLMRHHHDSNAPRYLQAQRLRVGDSIFSINETIKEMKVIEIIRNLKRNDAFAPLTESGTLVVDNIIASCYADYEYHSIAHLVLFPFRFYHKIRNLGEDAYKSNELHPYIHILLFIRNSFHLFIHNL